VELVKDLYRRVGLRAIAVSGHTAPDEIAAGLAAGCIRYITKPVNWEQLREAVDQIMGETKPTALTPAPGSVDAARGDHA
jgi:DNA-binding response OmpR family regulator